MFGTTLGCGAQSATSVGSAETGVPGRGAAYSMQNPSAQVAKAATGFAGSCAFARPPGDESYSRFLKLSGPTPVYATADFSAGTVDTIGSIGPAINVHGAGPLSGGAGAGAGFAVLLLDTNGRVCRGYILSGAVEASEPETKAGKADGAPSESR